MPTLINLNKLVKHKLYIYFTFFSVTESSNKPFAQNNVFAFSNSIGQQSSDRLPSGIREAYPDLDKISFAPPILTRSSSDDYYPLQSGFDLPEFGSALYTRSHSLPDSITNDDEIDKNTSIAYNHGYSSKQNSTEDRGFTFTYGKFKGFGVADGHGGSLYYSKYATANFQFKFIDALKIHPDDIIAAINLAIANMQSALDIIYANERRRGGSTFSVIIIDYETLRAYTATLGDSPILILSKKETSYEIKYRSNDHDVQNPDEVARVMQANRNAKVLGNYMCLNSMLKIMTLRGFGDYNYNDPLYYPNQTIPLTGGFIGRIPETRIIDLEETDLIIVTSDGLIEKWVGNMLCPGRDETEICEDAFISMQTNSLNEIAHELIEKKLDRLVTEYMIKSKQDPQGPHRKHFKDMIQETMDNHVVITHSIKKLGSKSRKLDIFPAFNLLLSSQLDASSDLDSFEIDSCFSTLVRTDSCASGGGMECSTSNTLTRSNSI